MQMKYWVCLCIANELSRIPQHRRDQGEDPRCQKPKQDTFSDLSVHKPALRRHNSPFVRYVLEVQNMGTKYFESDVL